MCIGTFLLHLGADNFLGMVTFSGIVMGLHAARHLV